MEIQDYYDSFLSDIFNSSFETGAEPAAKFLQRALDLVIDSGSLDDYDVIHSSGKSSNRWQLDAWHLDERFNTLHLIGMIFDEAEKPKVLSQADVDRMVRKLFLLLEHAVNDPLLVFNDKTDIQRTAIDIKRRWGSITNITFTVISNRIASSRFKKVGDVKFENLETKVDVWDFQRFFSLESAQTEREELIIQVDHGKLPFLKASVSETTNSYLCVVPALLLVEVYETWTSRLLEQNVRSFLQYRGKINKGIRRTIVEDPHHFFAYNNGLTTTATEIAASSDGRYLIQLINFQIVNGGQTTAALHQAFKEKLDISGITVQMKLTVVDSFASPELVSNIANFANSQNPVSAADLFSNHPFHVRIEDNSRRIKANPVGERAIVGTHWFYERSRGQYLNEQRLMTRSARSKFQEAFPRDQLITKTDLALCENSWGGLPHQVSKGAQTNFLVFAGAIDSVWEKDNKNFNDIYFQEACAKLLIQRSLRRSIMKAEWYQGYPANIVAYTIGWFADSLKKANVILDLNRIWNTQKYPDQLDKFLLTLAIQVNDHILEAPGNVTTYCKSIRAFNELVERYGYANPQEISSLLGAHDKQQERKKDSKEQQALDTELMAETELIMISDQTWKRISAYLISNDEMTPGIESSINASKKFQLLSKSKRKILSKLVGESGGVIENRSSA